MFTVTQHQYSEVNEIAGELAKDSLEEDIIKDYPIGFQEVKHAQETIIFCQANGREVSA